MWCSTCQQDIPAIASPEDQVIRCAKCRREVASPGDPRNRERAGSDPESDSIAARFEPSAAEGIRDGRVQMLETPPFDFDAWEWDELSEARRAIGTWTHRQHEKTLDEPEAFELPVLRRTTQQPHKTVPKRRPKTRRFSTLAWCILSLGVMACVFGGVLLIWSFVTGRAELWSLGLPFAIGGQAALVMGLVLQLDGLWQSNDEAVESLGELDQQLLELRRATSQISATHSRPGQSFYFHMAEGCSPHMLLADLKGQLDLLALRIGDEGRR